MNAAKRSFLIIAFALILAGGFLFLYALSRVGFDVKKLGSEPYGTEEISLTEPFSSVNAKLLDCSLTLADAPDGQTRAVVTSSKDAPVTLKTESGALVISQGDGRPWYRRIGFFDFGGASVVLYLSAGETLDLRAETASGDVCCNVTYPFGTADVTTVSGEISWNVASAAEMNLKTTSGDIEIRNSAVRRGITINSTSGEVTLDTCETESTLYIRTTSGDIELRGVTAAEPLTVKTVSGKIKTDRVSVGNVGTLESTSGDMLLGDVTFSDTCHIKTTSGDVHFLRACAKDFRVETVSGDVSGSVIGEAAEHRGSGARQGKGWSVSTVSGYVHIYPAE